MPESLSGSANSMCYLSRSVFGKLLRRAGLGTLILAVGILSVSRPLAAQVSVTTSPTGVNVSASGTTQFTATVTGATNTSVTWAVLEGVPGGTVSSTGLYTAPASPGTFHIVATSQADTT